MRRLSAVCEVCDVVVNTLDESEGYSNCIANEVGRAALMSFCGEIAIDDFLAPSGELPIPNDWMHVMVPVPRRVLVPELAKKCEVIVFKDGMFTHVRATVPDVRRRHKLEEGEAESGCLRPDVDHDLQETRIPDGFYAALASLLRDGIVEKTRRINPTTGRHESGYSLTKRRRA